MFLACMPLCFSQTIEQSFCILESIELRREKKQNSTAIMLVNAPQYSCRRRSSRLSATWTRAQFVVRWSFHACPSDFSAGAITTTCLPYCPYMHACCIRAELFVVVPNIRSQMSARLSHHTSYSGRHCDLVIRPEHVANATSKRRKCLRRILSLPINESSCSFIWKSRRGPS